MTEFVFVTQAGNTYFLKLLPLDTQISAWTITTENFSDTKKILHIIFSPVIQQVGEEQHKQWTIGLM